jgi:RNA polymerase sigma-70 factor (ECF subfamily)
VAFRVAWRVVHDRDDALDVVQDAFVRAFEKLETFTGESSFRSWLLRIVSNRAIDVRRSRRVRRTLPFTSGADDGVVGVPEPSADDPPESSAERGELQAAIASAMDLLSDEARQVISMYAGGEMTYQEIADALGIPIGTVMSRLYHARRRMREMLSEHLGEAEKEASER